MRKIINDTELVPVTITDLTLESTISEGKTNPPTTDAVAKAIAGGGGGSYTAGDGISIAEGEISAKVDGTTISVNASGELEAIGGGSSYTAGDGVIIDNGEIKVKLEQNGGLEFKTQSQDITGEGDTVINEWGYLGVSGLAQYMTESEGTYTLTINNVGDTWYGDSQWQVNPVVMLYKDSDHSKYVITDCELSANIGDPYTVDAPFTISFDVADVTSTWTDWQNELDHAVLSFMIPGTSPEDATEQPWNSDNMTYSYTVQFVVTVTSQDAKSIKVSNPLPDTSGAQEGDMLKINSYGVPVWGGLSSTVVNSYDYSVSDIAVVNSLPADPSSTTLYLIPEA